MKGQFRLYLTDIGQYPLLTKDDEVRLAQEIEAGTEARAFLKASCPMAPAITSTKKRELRRAERRRRANVLSFNPTCVLSYRRRNIGRQAYLLDHPKKETLVLCTLSNLTGVKASNFLLMPRGGSDGPSLEV